MHRKTNFLSRRTRVNSFCFGLIIGGLLLMNADASIKYKLTELRGLNSPEIHGLAINNGGEVIGIYYWKDYSYHSFIYRGGALHDLGSLSGYARSVSAINNYGVTVGLDVQLPVQHNVLGYLESSQGKITSLGSLDNAVQTEPASISDSGISVGLSYDDTKTSAFVYRAGRISALGNFEGHPLTRATDINNREQILAWYTADDGTDRTVLISGGQMQDLGLVSGTSFTEGLRINDHGLVLVNSGRSGSNFIYYLYQAGEFRRIPGAFTGLYGMNNSGALVGLIIGGGKRYPVLCDGVQSQDLNTLIDPKAGVHLNLALAINDSGQIIADGTNASGLQVCYILTPVK